MVPLTALLLALTLRPLNAQMEDVCPKGQKVASRGGRKACTDCDHGYFQADENRSQTCKVCTVCETSSGSVQVEECTKDTNTVCQCRGEYVPSDNDSSTCKCDVGFGLELHECSKCKEGYFSNSINSRCQKWRECKSGVKMNGTNTSNVVCNEEPQGNSHVITAPTSHNTPSLIRKLISQPPHEGATNQKILTTTTAPAPGQSSSPKNRVQPVSPSNTGNHIGILVIFAILGLLGLTVVTCKLHITPLMEKQPVQKPESLCRRPVPESGDSSRSSLKLNSEEN